ncbi:hypothetical protein POTOM_031907 [Populus tomentosa]|uniref:Cyclin C-terminal domain-containing protein n=1 Tax=Populus tomentosa TaxID=118781 RepID=A0A8X7Z3F1_POPTO|nr:hypothetical protein POTOM_031907 [Populus tomentosa]
MYSIMPHLFVIVDVNDAYSRLEDLGWWLRSSLWLQFKPHHIAAGAAYLAAKFLNFDLAFHQNIWREFETTPAILQDVSQQLMELFHARETKGDAHHKKLHLKYRSNGSAVRLACAYCKRVGRSIVQNVSTCCKIEQQISSKPNLGAVSIFNLIYA